MPCRSTRRGSGWAGAGAGAVAAGKVLEGAGEPGAEVPELAG
jgi:hypothetical protein